MLVYAGAGWLSLRVESWTTLTRTCQDRDRRCWEATSSVSDREASLCGMDPLTPISINHAADDRLHLARDMILNGRHCTLRVTVVNADDVDVEFRAKDEHENVAGLLAGTVRTADLLTVAKAITSMLGATAVALGQAVPNNRLDLESIREIYPNAYEPWSADEEARLIQRCQEGATMLELRSEFGRNARGIEARIKLHGLPKPRTSTTTSSNEEYAESDVEPAGYEDFA